MATVAQIQANRRNAARSTGPTSDAGKARSGRNRLAHGLFAEELVLSQFGETQQDFDDSLAELEDYFHPVGPIEKSLVMEIAAAGWRHNRALRLETAYLQHYSSGINKNLVSTGADAPPPSREDHNDLLGYLFGEKSAVLNRFAGYVARLARSRDQAITRLTRLQRDRRAEEAKAQAAREKAAAGRPVVQQVSKNEEVTENSRNEPNFPPDLPLVPGFPPGFEVHFSSDGPDPLDQPYEELFDTEVEPAETAE